MSMLRTTRLLTIAQSAVKNCCFFIIIKIQLVDDLLVQSNQDLVKLIISRIKTRFYHLFAVLYLASLS
jgi:hypothetical protein